jgi:hypothetical protein
MQKGCAGAGNLFGQSGLLMEVEEEGRRKYWTVKFLAALSGAIKRR